MYKALISFTGIVTMAKGQEAEIKDIEIAKDLLRAGYIEEVKQTKKIEVAKEVTEKKSTKKK